MPAKVEWLSSRCPWLVPVMLDPERDRDAWVAARVSGLGGSEVAALVGEHPQKSAIDVWQEKVGAAVPTLDNDRTRVGRLLEPVVIDWYSAGGENWPRTGGPYVVAKPPTCYHRDRPWQRGSPDGLVYLPEQADTVPDRDLIRSPLVPDHMLEVKTHGWFASRAYGKLTTGLPWLDDTGAPVDVPPDKRIQCAWYMELFDIDRCHLLALVDTHIQRTFVLHRDREVGAYLLEEAERFWREHVLTMIPPPPDGSESFGRYLAQRFRDHRPDLLLATKEVNDAARKLLRVKRAEKKLERIRDLLEQQIKLFIGDAAGVKTLYGAITWKSQASGRLKDKELRGELYKRAGLTDAEIEALEERFRLPDHRVMRTPK